MSGLTEYQDALCGGRYPVCGIDEAGRGPLAGPVCAAAVILPRGIEIPGLNDSKKLTEKKRELLYGKICEAALSYGIAFADVAEIESLNILGAAMLAMRRAFEKLSAAPELTLVDGNRDPGLGAPTLCVVGGDGLCLSVAAASVLAKVTRDRYMYEMAVKYPQYRFDKHKGYGTALHYAALREYGPCELHRPSFLRKLH